MVESGAFPSRTDAFPAGLRVLVVDDDLTWLKILEKMLKKCSYQVTTCCLAREALNLLRERRDGFDIVISDVNMPDMNGFKLLEYVGLEMDLPVIMMSVDWETSKVMKGVQHGACDYLLKPIKMKELRNIWQHVVRKKIHEVKEIESLEHRGADIQMLISEMDHFEDKYFEMGVLRRRKDPENKRHVDDLGVVDSLTSKKARVVWSVDLHRKFVDAVNQIGIDKVGPKKVLTLMNVPGLTRENVASHLQKYRLYLSRMQKEEALKQQQQDFSCADSVGGFGLEDISSIGQNNDVVTVSDFGYTMPVTSMGPSALQGDLEGIVPFMPVTKPETALTAEGMDIKYEPTLQIEQWDHEATMIQQLWNPKQQLLEPYGHFQANPFALSPKSSFPERDKMRSIDMPSLSAHYSQNDSNLTSIALPAMNQETLEAVTSMTKWEPFLQEPISGDSKNALTIATHNLDFSEYCYNNPELFAELQAHCYDELGFHCDRFEVPMENPVLEQGLFMV